MAKNCVRLLLILTLALIGLLSVSAKRAVAACSNPDYSYHDANGGQLVCFHCDDGVTYCYPTS